MKLSSLSIFAVGSLTNALAATTTRDAAAISSVLGSLSSFGGSQPAWSSAIDSLKSQGIIPPTLTAGPSPTGGWGPGKGPWGPGGPGWGVHTKGPGGRPWGGPDGSGPWGPDNWGPFSDWSTKDDWRTAPWTNWWGGSACPGSDWPGWTAGPWSTDCPWTTWDGCTATTTGSHLYTTTAADGKPAVKTAYDIQVAQVENNAAATGGANTGGQGVQGASGPMRTAAPVALGAAILGLAAAL